MKRRSITLLFLIALLASSAQADAASGASAERPNIIFIIADDQSPFDLKVYDPSSPLETPQIDRLAAQGMVIENAYHMGAWAPGVCTPSRHMIMSGRTLWHVPDKKGQKNRRNPNIGTPLVPSDLADFTLGKMFKNAGYDTMRTCKGGNSYMEANQHFDVRHDASKRGDTDASGSGWHSARVLDFLEARESAGDKDPFMIYFGFSHPHDTRDGKPELLAKYGAINHVDKKKSPPNPDDLNLQLLPKLPPAYLPKHPFDNSDLNSRDEKQASGVWENRDEWTIRNELGREYACSENIDIQIGKVLGKLEEMGELDNTYIFYTSDHGIAIGRHGLQGKQNLYEHTWRVPFIVKGPGIKPGRATGNIYLYDVLATLLDLANIPAPKTNEGHSFKSVLEGKKPAIREVLYGAYSGAKKPGIRSVRKGDWKLIRYYSPQSGIDETQLFNLAENPHELIAQHHDSRIVELTGYKPKHEETNLADDPKYVSKRKELEALLLQQQKSHDDPFLLSK